MLSLTIALCIGIPFLLQILFFTFSGVGFNYVVYATSPLLSFLYFSIWGIPNPSNKYQLLTQQQGQQSIKNDTINGGGINNNNKKKRNSSSSSSNSSSNDSLIGNKNDSIQFGNHALRTEATSIVPKIVPIRNLLGICLSLVFVLFQHDKWFSLSDQSDAYWYDQLTTYSSIYLP